MEVDGEEQQQSWARAEELQVVALLKVGVQGAHKEYPGQTCFRTVSLFRVPATGHGSAAI